MRLGIAFGDDRRVEAAQQPDGIPERGVDENQPIGSRQTAQLLAADGQLPGRVAEADALLCHRLIEAERGGAAAVAEQHDAAHTALLASGTRRRF